MSVASLAQAQDEILSTFRTAWLANVDSAGVPVLYPDVAQDVPTAGAWARVTLLDTGGRQATLSGEVGRRQFEYVGVVIVQVFTPTGTGQVLNSKLVQVAKDAFEGVTTVPGRVVFRNARYGAQAQDGVWFRKDVLADYEYEQIK